MKICWDNLEGVKFTKQGNFRINNDVYVEKDNCKYCGESFLTLKYRKQDYCCKSCGKMGKLINQITKLKISKTRIEKGSARGKNNPMFGKKRVFSQETKDKISVALSRLRKGKNNTMYGMCGPLSPTWQGGKSFEPYCADWTKEYKEYIKERDGNKCLNPYCSSNKSTDLTVHHINYNKKNCKQENLITICRSCNSRANKDRKWHEAWYQAIINKRYGGF